MRKIEDIASVFLAVVFILFVLCADVDILQYKKFFELRNSSDIKKHRHVYFFVAVPLCVFLWLSVKRSEHVFQSFFVTIEMFLCLVIGFFV